MGNICLPAYVLFALLGVYLIVNGVVTIRRREELTGRPWGSRGVRYTEDAVFIIGVSTLLGGILIMIDVILPLISPQSIGGMWFCGLGIMVFGSLIAYHIFGEKEEDR